MVQTRTYNLKPRSARSRVKGTIEVSLAYVVGEGWNGPQNEDEEVSRFRADPAYWHVLLLYICYFRQRNGILSETRRRESRPCELRLWMRKHHHRPHPLPMHHNRRKRLLRRPSRRAGKSDRCVSMPRVNHRPISVLHYFLYTQDSSGRTFYVNHALRSTQCKFNNSMSSCPGGLNRKCYFFHRQGLDRSPSK